MKKQLTHLEMSARGGKARAKSMTKAQRREYAVLAAMARWHGVPVVADKGLR